MCALAVDLFCGLGGWTEALLEEGWTVIGFDIERHDYGTGGYPGQLVLQDIMTLHGRQLKDIDLIVASPPCQEYSYMAMPWSKAKAIQQDYLTGKRDVKKLTALFDACFRIQREASEAAGRKIPMVVENVRGAQKWIGQAKWHYGSYYLWGDVPALMPWESDATKVSGFRFDGSGKSFQTASVNGVKVGGFSWSNYGKNNYVPQGFNRTAEQGIKLGSDSFNSDESSVMRRMGSKTNARKAASAIIAKIPYPLAVHIARVFKPTNGPEIA